MLLPWALVPRKETASPAYEGLVWSKNKLLGPHKHDQCGDIITCSTTL